MDNKSLPPAKINPQKLLGGSKISSIVKTISVKSGQNSAESSVENLFIIKKQVIEIKDLVKTNFLLKRKEENEKRKLRERKRFSEKEEKLEKPKESTKDKVKLPSAPKLGFLDRIKQFLFNIILGRIALILLPNLPKLSGIVSTIVKIQDNIIDWSGKVLNGLITFIDKGYEVYDQSRKILKDIGGNNFVNVFDGFTGAIDKVIEASIIAAIAFGELSGGDGDGGPSTRPRRGFDNTGRRVSTPAQRRYYERYGRGRFLERFGKEGLENLPKSMRRGLLTRLGRRAFIGTLGRGGAKAVLGTVRPLLKRLPIVGALIDFGLSVALGENPGRAAFKAIGAGLLGSVGAAVGSVVPFAGTFLGGLAGGALGDMAGGALYDVFFGKKTPSKSKIQGRAQGGAVTRGGRLQTGPKRRVKKVAKRQVSVTVSDIKPGSEVGGEKKIEKIFPQKEQKEKGKKDKVNPLGYIKDFYKKTSTINYFGPIFSIAVKRLTGDKVSRLDYKNAGRSLNSWLSNTFAMNSVVGAFAEGGEVNAQMFMNGDDLTNVIAKSVEENTASKLEKVLNDLQKQLLLEPRGGPGTKDQPATPQDMIDIQGGTADFWTLVAIASREDGDPEGWADVAQSIYNRLASGAYSGSSIKDLILGRMQYEPTWKFPRPGARGVPNPEWSNITDIATASAATGQSQDALKKVAEAILSPSLQQKARQFVQGRTDFRGYQTEGGIQRKSGDNYFGWYDSYTENKIGAVPNFGASLTAGRGGSSSALAQAAQSLRGMSSSAGPGGGRVACVWAVNQVFRRAGIRPPWGNSEYVPTAESSMISAGYQRIPSGQQRPGDLYIVARQEHIGIVLPNGNIISNSSSGARFSWEAPLSSYQSYYGGPGKFYRMPAPPSRRRPAPPSSVASRRQESASSQVAQRIVSDNTSVANNINKTGTQLQVAFNNAGMSSPVNDVKFMSTGGKVKGFTRAILGEEGPEFVIDADSTKALELNYPGFLDALNKADYTGALEVLKTYASYEASAPIYVSIDKEYIPFIVPVQMQSSESYLTYGSKTLGGKDDYMATSYKKG